MEEEGTVTSGTTHPAVAMKLLHRAFDDDSVEDMYQRDCQQSKQSDGDCFFFAVFLVAVHSVASVSLTSSMSDYRWQDLTLLILSGCVAGVQTALWVCVRCRNQSKYPSRSRRSKGSNYFPFNALFTRISICLELVWLAIGLWILRFCLFAAFHSLLSCAANLNKVACSRRSRSVFLFPI